MMIRRCLKHVVALICASQGPESLRGGCFVEGFAAAFPRAARITRCVAHDAPISVHRDIAPITRKGRFLAKVQQLRCFSLIVAENFLGRG